MFGAVIRWNPAKHVRISLPEVEGFLRREAGTERMFTYYHLDTSNWLVGVWANESARRFMEFKVIAENVEAGKRPDVPRGKLQDIVRMWKAPGTSQAWIKILAGAEAEHARRKAGHDEEYLDEGASIGRRTRIDQRSPWFDFLSKRKRRNAKMRPTLVLRGY